MWKKIRWHKPLGSLFTDPTGPLPAPNAHSLQVLDHASKILFTTPFSSHIWHNFAVQVDWDKRTLAAFYSEDDAALKAVTEVVSNLSVAEGTTGQGDFHIALLKVSSTSTELVTTILVEGR